MQAFVDECSCRWWEDPTYDRAVHSLLVVASVQRNQRLCTETSDTMSAESHYFGQCVLRRLYSEGREANMAAVRRVVVQAEEALAFASCAREIDLPPSARRLVGRLMDALRGALLGVANLTETYRDDARTTATLRQIGRHIHDLLAAGPSVAIE